MPSNEITVHPGLRIGLWTPGTYRGEPFRCLGFYQGPIISPIIVGQTLEQELLEGVVRFKVGVLFRPDLGKWNTLETILILVNYVEEMWNYETWEQATG